MTYRSRPLKEYLKPAAAAQPTPGGGSVAAVLEALESPSWLLRATAAQALSDANCRTDDVLAALEKRLDDPVNLVRANALLALRTLGKTFPTGHFQER